MSTRRVAVVTNMSITAYGWNDALGGCDVVGTDVDRASLADHDVIIIDSAGIDLVKRLLPHDRARCVWVHAGITTAQLRAARALGVDLVLHRDAGLDPLRDLGRHGRPAPMISLLGAASGNEQVGEGLSLDDVVVLRLLSRGATVAEVRRFTGYTASRVERIRLNILDKLGVQSTGEAMGRALALGIIQNVGGTDAV